MIRFIEDYLMSNWAIAGCGPRPQKISFSLISKGERKNGRIICLVFTEGERHPELVVKFNRHSDDGVSIKQEGESIALVRRLCEESELLSTLPHVLFLTSCDRTVFMGHRMAQGINTRLQARCQSEKALCSQHGTAMRWLFRFQKITAKPDAKTWVIENILDDYTFCQQRISFTERERAYLERLREPLAALTQTRLVPCAVHGDFQADNILNGRGKMCILDWEFAREGGVPLFDYFYYVILALRDYWGNRCTSLISKTGARLHRYRRMVGEDVENIKREYELSDEQVEALFVACCLSCIRRTYERLEEEVSRGYSYIIGEHEWPEEMPYEEIIAYGDRRFRALIVETMENQNGLLLT